MRTQLTRVSLDVLTSPQGTGMQIPRSGTGGGGQYGSDITNEDRLFTILREPTGYRLVVTVAHDVFDNWFNLKLKGEKEKKKSEDFDQKVQKILERIRAKEELTRMAIFERGFGWSILAVTYKDTGEGSDSELGEPSDIIEVVAYGAPQITSVEEDKQEQVGGQPNQRYGLPLKYYVKQKGIAGRLKIHFTRAVLFSTRRIENDWRGQSVLDPCWDDLTTLRNIRWSLGQTLYRYGAGFPDITLEGYSLDEIEAFRDGGMFSDISNRTYFVHNEKQTIDFKGTAGRALNPEPYVTPIVESISLASGVPLAILRGVQAGALTGSEVNEREYFNLISDEQTAYEPGIRDLIDSVLRCGLVEGYDDKTDYVLEWKSGIEMTEQHKADVDLTQANMLAVKAQWLSLNEIRKLEDPQLSDLKIEGADDRPLSMLTASSFGGGGGWHVTEVPNKPKNGEPRPSGQSS